MQIFDVQINLNPFAPRRCRIAPDEVVSAFVTDQTFTGFRTYQSTTAYHNSRPNYRFLGVVVPDHRMLHHHLIQGILFDISWMYNSHTISHYIQMTGSRQMIPSTSSYPSYSRSRSKTVHHQIANTWDSSACNWVAILCQYVSTLLVPRPRTSLERNLLWL